MFSNEQVAEYVVDLTKEMQQHINILESEIKKTEPDNKAIALSVGKLSKIYSLITTLVGTFTGEDMRQGGFKEAAIMFRTKKKESSSGN